MSKKHLAKKLPQPEALSHVLYEMLMLRSCLLLCERAEASRALRSLYLEGFLIHARCLREFFCINREKNPDESDDLRPAYFGIVTQTKLSGGESWDRMNKEIAHLSHARRSNPNIKRWNLAEEYELLRPHCFRFLEEIARHREWLSFKDNRQQLEALLSVFQSKSIPHREIEKTDVTTATSATHALTGYHDHTDSEGEFFKI